MEHAPTLFGILEALIPIGLQTLAACAVILLTLTVLVRRDLDAAHDLIPPEGISLRNVVEILLEGIAGLMRDTIGPTWPRYVPLVGTLGLFILISNLMRQIPGFDGPTGYVETNLSWAILSVCVAEYAAIRHQGPVRYLKHMAGPSLPLAIIMFPVEIVNHFARLLSLTVRLTANMFADHTLLAVFLSFPIIRIFIPWVFVGLGLFVAFLQAFVFSFLTIIYIGQALEDAHA